VHGEQPDGECERTEYKHREESADDACGRGGDSRRHQHQRDEAEQPGAVESPPPLRFGEQPHDDADPGQRRDERKVGLDGSQDGGFRGSAECRTPECTGVREEPCAGAA
jgi:hypothetical protein